MQAWYHFVRLLKKSPRRNKRYYYLKVAGGTYGAGLLSAESDGALAEARIHHRVESVSREGTAGVDTQAGQSCLWERAQHRLQTGTNRTPQHLMGIYVSSAEL